MESMARMLILIGALLIGAGVLFLFLNKIPGFGKLPGDIFIKKDNYTFYFPLTTCILVSLLLSLFFYLFNQK